MKELKIAIVGCGVISDNHILGAMKHPNARIVALCDLEPSKAVKKAEKHSLNVNIYSHFYKMLDEEELDVVHIAIPHYLHVEFAVAALKKGINTILEKPVGINESELGLLLDEEKKSKAKLTICFQTRLNNSTRYAANLIKEDGGVLGSHCALVWDRDEEYYSADEWRGKWKTEGGGVLINQAIHSLDLITLLQGEPESVVADYTNRLLKNSIEVEDTISSVITFKDGTISNFYATNASRAYSQTTIFFKTKRHSIMIFDKKLYIDGLLVPEASDDAKVVGKACYGNGHEHLICAFYDALINGTQVPVTLESTVNTMKLVFASYNSCGKRILLR